jgi:hypothetical protein
MVGDLYKYRKMGTRSTIKFKYKGQTVCAIYHQHDGYIEGVGNELKEFIKSGTFVNGYTHREERQFNGFGCFIAQYIAEHKNGVGGLYITDLDDEQEYNYIVEVLTDNKVVVSCKEVDDFTEFVGSVDF